MDINERIDALVYQLIDLDEVAGSFDKDGNAKIDESRNKIKLELDSLIEYEDLTAVPQ
jgi:hypothetical protein